MTTASDFQPSAPSNIELKLNQKDNQAFINALLNPSRPNQALKKAAKRYRQIIKNHTSNPTI